MIRTIPWILLITFSITACGLLGGSNGDDGPPRTIVFSAQADEEGTFQIFSMREDGSGVRQLTDGEFSSTNPAWSPDGRRIAYARSTGSTAGEALWVMDANGGNKQPLVANPRTGSPQLGNRPAWSPDGTKLAFDLCLNCELGGSNFDIFVADLQTGTIDTLVQHPFSDSRPAWSPDGTQIAFVSDRNNPDQPGDIYLFELNTGTATRVTETGNAGRQVWSSQGDQLIYWTNNDLLQFDLTDSTKKILEINLPSEVGFRPLDVSEDGQKLLLLTFEFTGAQNRSLQVLDLESSRIEKIIMFSGLSTADWYTNRNSN